MTTRGAVKLSPPALRELAGAAAILLLGLLGGAAALVGAAFGLDALVTVTLGRNGPSRIFTGDSAPVKLWVQLLYLAAGVYVAVIAAYALRFARGQAEEAARSRAALLHSELRRTYDDPRFAESREMLQRLEGFHQRHRDRMPDACEAFDAYLTEVMLHLRANDGVAYARYTHSLDALEYIGMLCRTGLASEGDVLEIFGGQISFARKNLRTLCLALQRQAQLEGYAHPKAVYANALWLFAQSLRYTPYEF